VGSSTHQASNAGRPPRRDGGGDSPSLDGPYGPPVSARLPVSRMPTDRMEIDAPPQPDRRFQPERGYQPDSRPSYPADPRTYPSDSRQYQPEQPMSSTCGRQPVSSQYAPDSRYPPNHGQPNDGAPPGYVRQGNYYVPVTSASAYEPPPAMAPSRSEPPQYGNGPYGQPAPPPGRGDPRDPRYNSQPDYTDPRYAYPSPAATTSSVNARDRDTIFNPPQSRFASIGCSSRTSHTANTSSPYGSLPPQYDPYGRRKYR